MRSLLVIVLLIAFLQATFTYNLKSSNAIDSMPKREIKPDWEDLGWAWGKRSAPDAMYPRRFLRSMQLVKKNPDWHDLGWTWGRRK
ncbi:hypothetical protein ANCCAN_14742 [Ancylostoma caninum]|uniref:Uncharacterized protein n=1 Tax=Ancylostoma caninum TaxID=29170 RepID=A0A368G8K7_ANCCA|nr:hypothetical protein ANCCAN_23081 [Ancylostoma caninum]RCN39340.1 hypothetical protein ANCCAN_14742 [Ancylostoma caninum]